MKPSEMTTCELMERIGIGDASEMAAELGRRAARMREEMEILTVLAERDGPSRLFALNDLTCLMRVDAPSATTKGTP